MAHSPKMSMRFALFALVALLEISCVHPGALTDGSSVSFGDHRSGVLRHASQLPAVGVGYFVPERWQARQRQYGTDEIVGLIRRAAARVRQRVPRSLVGIADLSPLGGGPTREHGSHRSGRDVDFIYYALDASGRPVVPDEMIAYDGAGHSKAPPVPRHGAPESASKSAPGLPERPSNAALKPVPIKSFDPSKPLGGVRWASPDEAPRRLDLRRNWEFVKALLSDSEVAVQWLFISKGIKRRLLRYARSKGAAPALVARAELVMHQPGDASPHRDHGHIRVFCAIDDRDQGCIDRGPPRWLKKTIKYPNMPPVRPLSFSNSLSLALGSNAHQLTL